MKNGNSSGKWVLIDELLVELKTQCREAVEAGRREQAFTSAQNAIELGLTIEKIYKITGLSVEKIKEIKELRG